jgi:rSAM/selenodomain-associated transferase 1
VSIKPFDCCLIVFAKAPIPGRVKTRLIPFIGEEAATALHQKLVSHCLSIASEASITPVELWCSPSSRHPFFIHSGKEFRLDLHTQPKGDLGRRMAFAFGETLKKASSALLIGTDSPSLTPDDIKKAAEILTQSVDAVITPAEDGGYVLLGLRRLSLDLFSGIPWGTNAVMEETRLRLRRLKWKWHELPQRWDVDRPEDIERLRTEGHFIF